MNAMNKCKGFILLHLSINGKVERQKYPKVWAEKTRHAQKINIVAYFINCMKQKIGLFSRVNTTYSDEVLPETHHKNGNEPKIIL